MAGVGSNVAMTSLNVLIVAQTNLGVSALMSPGKPPRKFPRIVSKMPAFDESDISASPTTLNGRTNLAVMSCRPPPGGPRDPIKTMSMILRNAKSFFRSNHPPWENHCRRISIGGCAPYVSRFGMFRSSTWIAAVFPAGGPKTPRRRFSNFPSNVSCVMLADVWAENVMTRGDSSDGAVLPSHLDTPCRYWEIVTVLPVPVSPTIMQWYLDANNFANT